MNTIVVENFTTELDLLLDEVLQVCEHVLYRSAIRLEQQEGDIGERVLSKSCVNLAHYLALRELDLRPLQERLAEAGLSSLGRAESHVLATLQAVVSMLNHAVGKNYTPTCRLPYPEFHEGYARLIRHTERMFGANLHRHDARIMVTLPTEAATDPGLIDRLIQEGMDCARINCAHDSSENWSHMIQHVRHAAQTHARECRILMDLAGHKVRTGPIAMEAGAIPIKVKKNPYSRTPLPTQLRLISDRLPFVQAAKEAVVDLILPDRIIKALRPGDRLRFSDTRGRKRELHIIANVTAGVALASCIKSARLASGSYVYLQRKSGLHYRTLHSFVFENKLQQAVKILLKPGDELVLHATPEPGEPARYNEKGKLIAPAHISCTLPQAIDALSPGDPVWIDDGKISCVVSKTATHTVTLKVLRAGPKGAKLKADKGLNFPETALKLPALSDKDKQDLDFVCQHADMVGFSFVESGDDIRLLIHELRQRQRAQLPIVAKIETPRAVRQLPDILFSCLGMHPLGIMIARGDLAVELGSVRMAEIQEEMLWLCEAAHVPVIWATQVLESIAKHGVRSRPEFTDAAMGIRAECVMLNKGPYILDAVRSLRAVLNRMQGHQRKKISRLRALHW